MANKEEIKEAADKDALDTKIASAVEKAMTAALPLAMAGVAQILKPAPAATAPAPEFASSDRCDKCLQLRRVCKNLHVKLKVHPENPRRFERFPGIIVNGIHYISPRFGAAIFVPLHNDILQTIQTWENEEDNLREGHVLNHNSGVLSPNPGASQVNNANPMGFRGMNPGQA